MNIKMTLMKRNRDYTSILTDDAILMQITR